MIIVRFCGGLGNQLFQYALYLKLASLGKQVYADLNGYSKRTEKRRFQLGELGIEVKEPNYFHRIMSCPSKSPLYLINKYLGFAGYYYEKNYYSFDEHILDLSNGYLDGYWQNPQYFRGIEQTIKESLVFPNLNIEQNELRRKMLSENSVFVHVRMGDYLTYQALYGNICTKEYFMKAFQIMDDIEHPCYYGFSDDIRLASDFLGRDDICWVDHNNETDAYNDLFLMSSCRNAIISNSSFSWWGAFLIDNRNALILAPSKWMNGITDCGVWCDNWTKLSV